MNTLGYGKTNVGKKRESNEDSVYANSELGLYVISDGMGGHQAGEVASALAVEVAVGLLTEQQPLIRDVAEGQQDAESLTGLVRQAAEAACREVYTLSRTKLAYRGMGGTLTILQVAGDRAAMAHVGDTRLYRVRGGEAHQLSKDHTLAAELIEAGMMTVEMAEGSRYRSVLTRAIGQHESVKVDTLLLDLRPGDRFLLCSDGLSEYIADEAWLARVMAAGDDMEKLTDELVDHANDAGGSDNIGVVVVQVERPLKLGLFQRLRRRFGRNRAPAANSVAPAA